MQQQQVTVAMKESVTALQTIPLFDVVKLKLFFSNFFTNQDPEGFKTLLIRENLLLCLEKKALWLNYYAF